MSFFVAGAVLGEVQLSLFVAGAVLGEVQVALFVAGAVFGDVQVALFVAGAVFGEVVVSLFVAGAVFGEKLLGTSQSNLTCEAIAVQNVVFYQLLWGPRNCNMVTCEAGCGLRFHSRIMVGSWSDRPRIGNDVAPVFGDFL